MTTIRSRCASPAHAHDHRTHTQRARRARRALPARLLGAVSLSGAPLSMADHSCMPQCADGAWRRCSWPAVGRHSCNRRGHRALDGEARRKTRLRSAKRAARAVQIRCAFSGTSIDCACASVLCNVYARSATVHQADRRRLERAAADAPLVQTNDCLRHPRASTLQASTLLSSPCAIACRRSWTTHAGASTQGSVNATVKSRGARAQRIADSRRGHSWAARTRASLQRLGRLTVVLRAVASSSLFEMVVPLMACSVFADVTRLRPFNC